MLFVYFVFNISATADFLLVILAYADASIKLEADSKALCMEDQLRSLGILDTCNNDSIAFYGINLEANLPPRKVRFLLIENTKSNILRFQIS